MIQGLTGGWTYSTFGFIAAALMLIPWFVFFFGARLRARSPFYPHMAGDAMQMKMGKDEEMQMSA